MTEGHEPNANATRDAARLPLTDEQRRIVEAPDGPLVVIAGAGTGKTNVIVERVRWLLETHGERVATTGAWVPAEPAPRHGEPFTEPLVPEQLLVLTYNVKAAAELGERLDKVVGAAVRARVTVSNFHSFCHHVLTESAADADLPAAPDVLDGPAQLLLLWDLRPTLDLRYHGDYSYGPLVGFINRAKDELVTPDEFDAFVAAERIEYERRYGSFAAAESRLLAAGNLDSLREVQKAYGATRRAERAEDLGLPPRKTKPDDPAKAAEREARRTFAGDRSARALQDFPDDVRPRIVELADAYERDGAALEVLRLTEMGRGLPRLSGGARRARRARLRRADRAVAHLFKTRPNVLRRWQRQYRYLLIDEFQDANIAQIELIELLGRTPDRPDNVMVVGDDDQSIYRFRGASYAAFAEFEARFSRPPVHAPDASPPGPPPRLRIDRNFRSVGHVLTVANRLIARNSTRFEPDKRLHTTREAGVPVELHICADEEDEAVAIVDAIRELAGPGPRGARQDEAAAKNRMRTAPPPRGTAGATSRSCTASTSTATRSWTASATRTSRTPSSAGSRLFDTPEIRDLEQGCAPSRTRRTTPRSSGCSPPARGASTRSSSSRVTRDAKFDRIRVAEAINASRRIRPGHPRGARPGGGCPRCRAAPASSRKPRSSPPSTPSSAACSRSSTSSPRSPGAKARTRCSSATSSGRAPCSTCSPPAPSRHAGPWPTSRASCASPRTWQEANPDRTLAGLHRLSGRLQGRRRRAADQRGVVRGRRRRAPDDALPGEGPRVPDRRRARPRRGRVAGARAGERPVPARAAARTGARRRPPPRRGAPAPVRRDDPRQGAADPHHARQGRGQGASPRSWTRSAPRRATSCGSSTGRRRTPTRPQEPRPPTTRRRRCRAPSRHRGCRPRRRDRRRPPGHAPAHRPRAAARAPATRAPRSSASWRGPRRVSPRPRAPATHSPPSSPMSAGAPACAPTRPAPPASTRSRSTSSRSTPAPGPACSGSRHCRRDSRYSSLDSYERCPLRYAFTYVYRMPEPARPRAPLAFGSTAHATFEQFTRERRERTARGEPGPTREDLERLFRERWVPTAFGDKETEAAYGRRIGTLLDTFWQGELSTSSEALAEECQFTLVLDPADGTPPVRIYGEIDRIDRLPSGGIEVIDYKTGSPSSQKDVHQNLQLTDLRPGLSRHPGLGHAREGHALLHGARRPDVHHPHRRAARRRPRRAPRPRPPHPRRRLRGHARRRLPPVRLRGDVPGAGVTGEGQHPVRKSTSWRCPRASPVTHSPLNDP